MHRPFSYVCLTLKQPLVHGSQWRWRRRLGVACREKDAALAKYKRLKEMADVPASMRQRAERMIVILGG